MNENKEKIKWRMILVEMVFLLMQQLLYTLGPFSLGRCWLDCSSYWRFVFLVVVQALQKNFLLLFHFLQYQFVFDINLSFLFCWIWALFFWTWLLMICSPCNNSLFVMSRPESSAESSRMSTSNLLLLSKFWSICLFPSSVLYSAFVNVIFFWNKLNCNTCRQIVISNSTYGTSTTQTAESNIDPIITSIQNITSQGTCTNQIQTVFRKLDFLRTHSNFFCNADFERINIVV